MGVLNRKKNTAPRAARSAKGNKSKRQPQGKNTGRNKAFKAGKQIADNYTGGAVSTLFGRNTSSGSGRRRINVMNAKAVRRAAARVRGSIKMLERLKKSLPHVTAKGKVTIRKKR